MYVSHLYYRGARSEGGSTHTHTPLSAAGCWRHSPSTAAPLYSFLSPPITHCRLLQVTPKKPFDSTENRRADTTITCKSTCRSIGRYSLSLSLSLFSYATLQFSPALRCSIHRPSMGCFKEIYMIFYPLACVFFQLSSHLFFLPPPPPSPSTILFHQSCLEFNFLSSTTAPLKKIGN